MACSGYERPDSNRPQLSGLSLLSSLWALPGPIGIAFQDLELSLRDRSPRDRVTPVRKPGAKVDQNAVDFDFVALRDLAVAVFFAELLEGGVVAVEIRVEFVPSPIVEAFKAKSMRLADVSSFVFSSFPATQMPSR